MIRRPPRSTLLTSSAASDVYKRQIMNQRSTAGYIEVTFGLKVKIFKNWSLGWNIVYHSLMHETKNTNGEPMFIPGFGKRGSSMAGNFSLMYTFPINKKKVAEVNNVEAEVNTTDVSEGDQQTDIHD